MPIRPQRRHPNKDRWQQDFASARTFGRALDRWAELWGEREALVDGSERVSYAQMRTRANRVAAFMHETGIRKGDAVLMRMGSTAGFFYAFFGLMRIGARPVLLRPGNRADEAAELALLTGPTLVLSLDEYHGEDAQEFFDVVLGRCPGIAHAMTEGELARVWQDARWDPESRGIGAEVLLAEDDTWNVAENRPESFAEGPSISHFILSGGTTGTPKVVALKPGTILFGAACYADLGLLGPDDRCLVVMAAPVNFSMCCDSIATFVSGGTVVLCPEPSPAVILGLIARERITHTSLVPAVARLCISLRQVYDKDDISSLRYVNEGGARVTEDVVRDTHRWLGARVMNAYGMSEGFYSSTCLDDDDDTICQGLCLGCLPGYEVRVVDAGGNELAPGELGEFQFRGSITLEGYHNNPEATAQSITQDGFYRTGDLAFVTEDGRVAVRGRVKDQINRGGMSVMPEAIETDVRRHPLVSDCVAIGAPDELLGQRIACFVIATGQIDRVSLADDLRKMGISEHHIPDDLHIVDAYPQTPNQKVDRRALLNSITKGA